MGKIKVKKKDIKTNITNKLKSMSFKEISKKSYDDSNDYKHNCFVRNYLIGEDIFGRDHKADFLIICPKSKSKKFAIKIKVQNLNGTTYRMIPFNFLTIKKFSIKTKLVLEGKGFFKEVLDWAHKEARKSNGLVSVSNLKDIIKVITNIK